MRPSTRATNSAESVGLDDRLQLGPVRGRRRRRELGDERPNASTSSSVTVVGDLDVGSHGPLIVPTVASARRVRSVTTSAPHFRPPARLRARARRRPGLLLPRVPPRPTRRSASTPAPARSAAWRCPTGRRTSRAGAASSARCPAHVVAAAFGVFNPEVVVPCVELGWSRTDAATICAGPHRRRRRAAATHPRRRARGARPGQRTARPGRRAAASGGPVAVRRASRRSASPTTRWRPRGGAATCCASTAATATSPRGCRPGSTPPRSACSPSSTGACRCARTAAPGRGPTSSSTPRPSASSLAGLIADGAFTEAGRALREDIEVHTDVQMRPAIDALGDDADELFALLAPVGRGGPGRQGLPRVGTARPRLGAHGRDAMGAVR